MLAHGLLAIGEHDFDRQLFGVVCKQVDIVHSRGSTDLDDGADRKRSHSFG